MGVQGSSVVLQRGKHLYDSVVVGGGLIGMLTARQLKLEGQSVLLLDQGALGSESSWAGGGILSPLYPWRYPDAISQLAAYSHNRYAQLAVTLQQESGIDPQWTQSGLLILDSEEKAEALAWAKQYNSDCRVIDQPGKVAELQAGLGVKTPEAIWMPGIAQLRNPRLMRAMKGSLEFHRIEYSEHEAVEKIDSEHGRITAVRTARRRISTHTVIVTAGAWSAALLKQVSVKVPIEPVRGQMLVYKGKPGLIKPILLYQGHYLIPRRDGHVLVGSTLEHVGYNKMVTCEARQALNDYALTLLPALSSFEIEKHWSGLRPGNPGGIPYVGAHPQVEGLYFNCGHFRYGVILGLATVHLMVSLMLGQRPFINPEPYALTAEH